MEEIWKDVPGYENLYQVSNKGNIRSLNYRGHGKVNALKPYKDKDGYLFLGLYKNKKRRPQKIHKLVVLTFIGDTPKGMQVDHLNGVKDDNRVENLEIVTPKENTIRAWRNGLVTPQWLGKHLPDNAKKKISEANSGSNNPNFGKIGKNSYGYKEIIQYDKNQNLIKNYYGAAEAERNTGVFASNIIRCCRGKIKTSGGYIWKYADEVENG